MSDEDLYETLGVARDASAAKIKAARNAKAKLLKPQADQGDDDKDRELGEVNHAYDVLGNPVTRAEWDLAHPIRTTSQPGPVSRPAADGHHGAATVGTRLRHVGILGGATVSGHGHGVIQQVLDVVDARIFVIKFDSGDARPILAGFAGLTFE